MLTLPTKYIIIVSCFFLFLCGCMRDQTFEPGGGEAGKSVTVTLQVNIPKAVTTLGTPLGRSSGSGFSVSMDGAAAQTRSDGTTKLHNLWLFQFDNAGNIKGQPHKISDTETSVNDMILLDVPLVVAEDQTLYLLALGRQIEADFSGITKFSDVESLSFNYTNQLSGVTKSKVTEEEDMPFSGYVKGVKVVEVETGENRGQVEYNTPDGFSGGIGIKRLMSKITMKYKFEVSDYKLDGMRLINANSTIRLTNPVKNDDSDNYVSLEGSVSATPDSDGFYTVTWYVAQNQYGDVDAIAVESDRYYKKLDDGTMGGAAPKYGTNIEAWAYSVSKPNSYAIYQMYVGKNNTKNFDVTANTIYNLRTIINTDIESAKNDRRIRSYNAEQNIYFKTSAKVSSLGGSIDAGVYYDLDAHCDTRPLTIYANGRMVNVGIYVDEACTQQADPSTSWLKLSSSSNYTDAYHNKAEPLNTFAQTDLIQLPTKLMFYLYNDEYIFDQNKKIIRDLKRSIYLKVTTMTKGAAGGADIVESSVVCRLDQRPALYMGRYGGNIVDGKYETGILCEQVEERAYSYGEAVFDKAIYIGYHNQNIYRNPLYSGVQDPSNGRLGTIQMVKNPSGLPVNIADSGTNNFKNPIIRPGGEPLLYQYNSDVSQYLARYCYDKNRDDDGSGIIEDDEIKWYAPGIYQLYGFYMAYDYRGAIRDMVSSTLFATKSWVDFNFTTGEQRYSSTNTSALYVRCVRDISMDEIASEDELTDEHFYIYDDGRGNKYGAIDAADVPYSRDRSGNNDPDLYVDVALFTYSVDGSTSTPVTDAGGNQVYVKRMRRHYATQDIAGVTTPNKGVSANFIIAPDFIDADGNAVTGAENGKMTWGDAMGYLATANTVSPETPSSAVARGCAMYRGKDGNDTPGSWRMPTQQEMSLMAVYIPYYDNISNTISAQKLSESSYYFMATEGTGVASRAWTFRPLVAGKPYPYMSYSGAIVNKANSQYVRCIRDLSPIT